MSINKTFTIFIKYYTFQIDVANFIINHLWSDNYATVLWQSKLKSIGLVMYNVATTIWGVVAVDVRCLAFNTATIYHYSAYLVQYIG